jgi:DNA (cytosine-5)-methyltransferase 1
VGLLWASPDCKHFSKAKGGKPVSKKIRSLAWIVIKWIRALQPTNTHPRVIHLENVEEFQTWGPLGPDQRPCPRRKGRTFKRWVGTLRGLGYAVEWRELRACDYGAPTIRKRLFLVARRDGQPIVWPEPTHAAPDSLPVRQKKLQPWRTAAECIDWSIPAPSIFERQRPLAEATCRRIAKGIMRYVVDAAEPVIVPMTHAGGDRVHSINEPVRTVTTARRGELALAVPTLIQTGYGERQGQAPRVPGLDKPMGTLVGSQKHALVAAFMAKHYGGVVGHGLHGEPLHTVTSQDHNSIVAAHLTKFRTGSVGSAADEPVHTVTAGGEPARMSTGNVMGVVTSHLAKLRGDNVGSAATEPVHTISAQGQHHAEVRAFLVKYYGTDQDPRLAEPMHTVPTRDRFGLVMVHGEPYAIVDIGMRMLTPRELYRAQGFPESYQIERGADGRELTKTAQVRMCGNSVCPPLARALVAANYTEQQQHRIAA